MSDLSVFFCFFFPVEDDSVKISFLIGQGGGVYWQNGNFTPGEILAGIINQFIKSDTSRT